MFRVYFKAGTNISTRKQSEQFVLLNANVSGSKEASHFKGDHKQSYMEKPVVRSEAGPENLHVRVNLEEEADQAFTLQKFNVPS